MIPYIINVALILAGCLVFYKLLLRKETFYRTNRIFLASCLFISFSLPLLPLPEQLSLRKTEGITATYKQPVSPNKTPEQYKTDTAQLNTAQVTSKAPVVTSSNSIDLKQVITWLSWLYWFGVIVFGFNFLLQIIILIRKALRNPVIIDGRYRIVEVSGDKAPCSFGNIIFINPEKYDWETYTQILMHEKIHVRQNHSFDIILAELVLIFQWFNPFAWMYRRQLEDNLEFLTDNELTQTEKVEKSSYQMSLLKVSAPHFPLSLTTNYNQSILKKRIAMMNTKRSNLHTTWKYFFLLPVLALFASLLNEPMAQTNNNKKERKIARHQVSTEGYWFAVIKDDKVNIRFSAENFSGNDETDLNGKNSFSGETFKLSELGNIPRGTEGKFSITREAGTMDMTGKFETNTGMGRYKFSVDAAYLSYMNTELKETLDEEDQLAFWFIDVKKSYLQMLRNEGYASITKDNLIPMAALHIDQAYIRSIKENGFKDITVEDLVPLKALNVDGAYIKEIRDAGYTNISSDQLVSFKAQGIDKTYIAKVKNLKGKDGKMDADGDDIVTYKALDITEDFANSFRSVGYTNIPHDQLVSLKSLNITPEFIRGFQNAGYKDINMETIVSFKALGITPEFAKSYEGMGYKNIDAEDLTALKSLNITPEYIRSFETMGYKNIRLENFSGLKAVGVTPEYIKSFEAIGYRNIDVEDLTGLKALNVTPEFIKGFEDIGFKNVPLEEFTSVKATGVTPEYIKSMRAKGFDYNKLSKYITLKSIN